MQCSKAVCKGRSRRFGGGPASEGERYFELGGWHAEVDKELTLESYK